MPPTLRRQSIYSTASSDTASSFIDLTDSPEPTMSSQSASQQGTKRTRSQREEREEGPSNQTARGRRKRARRVDREPNNGQSHASAQVNSSTVSAQLESGEESGGEMGLGTNVIDLDQVEEVDLTNDDLNGLGAAMQKQRADQIAAQRPQEEQAKPLRISNINCVICMDSPTDLTATSCGHVFCHTCLMEALIAGENRSQPGETRRSQCPVCRKNISRNKAADVIPLLLKKGLATQPKRSAGAAVG